MFAERAEMSGEESLIGRLIRARMRGRVCRTAAEEQAMLFGLGAVAAGSPEVKLEVTEIKVSRSSFTVTIRSGTKRKIKGGRFMEVSVVQFILVWEIR